MESDDQEIDYEETLSHQPWWFRWQWRFHEWRRQRYLRKLYAEDRG